MRAFIALDIPDSFRESLIQLSHQLSLLIKGRFVKSNTYHLTLAFLGEIDEADIKYIMPVLDNLSNRFRPITLSPTGLGTFGRTHDATLVLKLQKNTDLSRLVDDLRSQLTINDIDFDKKAFKPHITLARRACIPKAHFHELAFPYPNKASTLTLYKSTLTPEGALYKPLYQVKL